MLVLPEIFPLKISVAPPSPFSRLDGCPVAPQWESHAPSRCARRAHRTGEDGGDGGGWAHPLAICFFGTQNSVNQLMFHS